MVRFKFPANVYIVAMCTYAFIRIALVNTRANVKPLLCSGFHGIGIFYGLPSAGWPAGWLHSLNSRQNIASRAARTRKLGSYC